MPIIWFLFSVGVVFTLSMVTSFLSLVLFGLHFNERSAFAPAKFLVAAPMFAAFAGARAFTLAVFLKQTLGSAGEAAGGAAVLALFFLINVGAFSFCGQVRRERTRESGCAHLRSGTRFRLWFGHPTDFP